MSVIWLVPCCCRVQHLANIRGDVQDMPDGNFAELQKKGKKLKSKLGRESLYILGNYRMWCLAACYAVSFGVEVRCTALLQAAPVCLCSTGSLPQHAHCSLLSCLAQPRELPPSAPVLHAMPAEARLLATQQHTILDWTCTELHLTL